MSHWLNVFLVQTDLTWENPSANRSHLDQHVRQTSPGSLVVLPETFATGFTLNPAAHAQSMNGENVNWMKESSRDRLICGSVAIEDHGQYYNRFLAVYQGTIILQYDKRHLFSYAGENRFYQAGKQARTFEFAGWHIAPFICYDLRFPAWIGQCRGAEVMLFVANWPAERINAWNTLLAARAIENQCYVLGVNRLGQDGNGTDHNGCSQAIDYRGEHLIPPILNHEQVAAVVLKKAPLLEFRERFPFLRDAD
jgi:omega-amidase